MRARDRVHRLSRTAAPVAVLAVVLGLTGAAAAAPGPAGSVRLSDERSVTRWATPVAGGPIRTKPSPSAPAVTSLRMLTEDGYPEVYVLLRGWTDPGGRAWLQVRIPMRPHGRIGWVEGAALGPAQLVRTQLVIDRGRLRATLYRAGRRVWRSRVGIGKRNTPTPAGRFWIRERITSPNPRGAYGPLAFGTSAYSHLSDWPGGGVIGIHGTNQPDLIPGRPSHGCIRIPNRAIRRLGRLMPVGTPVWIR